MELALVLVLLGLAIGPGLSFFKAQRTLALQRMTRDHQKLIFEALQQYLAQHGRLPCPADPKSGHEIRGQSRSFCGQEGLAVGIVPYRSLGLSSRVARDGYGHWMTYAVDFGLAGGRETIRSFLCKRLFKEPSHLDVSEGETESINRLLVASNNTRDGVAVVLISHGPLGQGAFSGYGYRIPLSIEANQCKKKNCADKLSFCALPDVSDTGLCDDFVQWMTKSQLVRGAHIPCFDYFFPAPSEKK